MPFGSSFHRLIDILLTQAAPPSFSLHERKTNKSRGCSQGVVCAGITTSFKFLASAVSSTALCKWAWHASRSNTQSRFGNTCAKFLHKVSKYSPWSQLWPKKSFATKANPAPGRTLLQHRDGGAAHVSLPTTTCGRYFAKTGSEQIVAMSVKHFLRASRGACCPMSGCPLTRVPNILVGHNFKLHSSMLRSKGFFMSSKESNCTICRMRMPHNKKRDKWTQKQSSKFNPESGYCPCPCCLWAYCYWK